MADRTATFVRNIARWNGHASLYRVDPPVPWGWSDEGERPADHVVVSAVVATFSGPETYIFPADESGEVLNWSELAGSFRGGLDHDRALEGAGYRVVRGAK